MDALQISYAGALAAGLLSFVTPCVLPLVPAYLCFLGGASLDQLTAEAGVDKGLARRVFFSAFAFVLGFSTIFVLLGATATALSNLLAQHMELLGKIAGVIIILFGLHFTGLIRLGMLNLEKRVHPQRRPSGIAGSYLLGMAFAFGWTPCVGPILATILMVAAGGDSPWYGPSLLGVYAAGLGLPFLIAALAVGPFMTFAGRWRKHMHLVELLTGGLLIITGIAIFTGSLADVALWMLETFPIFSGVG